MLRAALACLWLAGCGTNAAPKDAPKERSGARSAEGDGGASAPRRVELARARSQPMDEQVAIAGSLAAQDEVVVRSKVAGRLASIEVDLGSSVRAGQPIAQIEPVDYRLRVEQSLAQLAQAKASLGLSPDDDRSDVTVDEATGVREAAATLEEARANFERSKQLVERKLIGRADYDAANATFLRAQSEVQRAREDVYQRLAVLKQRKAELGLARQQLADTNIRSPLDGVVQVRHASAGEFLAQGAEIATVVRIDPLRLRVEVPEREAARIEVGQQVSVQTDESPRSYAGRIARIAPMLNQQSRTLVVEAEIPNSGELKPGSFARARIALGQGAPVVTVPRSALVVFAGIEKVIGVENGKAVERPVKSGRSAGELVEVVEGLAAGDRVVVEPGTLQQGQPVVVAGERDTSSAALGGPERGARIE